MQTSTLDYDNFRHSFKTVSPFFSADIENFVSLYTLFQKFKFKFRTSLILLSWSQLIEFDMFFSLLLYFLCLFFYNRYRICLTYPCHTLFAVLSLLLCFCHCCQFPVAILYLVLYRSGKTSINL